MTGAAPITAAIVEDALSRAGAAMRTAPGCVSGDELEQARARWAWLALVQSPIACRILEARAATGAGWAAIGRPMDMPAADVQRRHRAALEEIAERLYEALEA